MSAWVYFPSHSSLVQAHPLAIPTRVVSRHLQEVQFGTIAGVRMITIQEDNADAGKIAGGLMGGSAGSTLGQGTGQFMGSVAGAMIGGTVGMVTDRNAQAQQGIELIVRLKDSNKTVKPLLSFRMKVLK